MLLVRKTLAVGAFIATVPCVIVEAPLSAIAKLFTQILPISKKQFKDITKWNKDCNTVAKIVAGECLFLSFLILDNLCPRKIQSWITPKIDLKLD
jgi:hypothetical protein